MTPEQEKAKLKAGDEQAKRLENFPEPPLGFDYKGALAEADYAKTEARIMAHYGTVTGRFDKAAYDADWWKQKGNRLFERPRLTRKQRRLAAQQARQDARAALANTRAWRSGL